MKDLSKKQKGFVQDYVKTGNATKSAMNNYEIESENKERVAEAIGSENLSKPIIQEAIRSIAEQIPDSLLVEKHLELLNVPKITKTTRKGDYIESEESTDVQAIKAGLDMAYKLKGVYAAEKKDISGTLQISGVDISVMK